MAFRLVSNCARHLSTVNSLTSTMVSSILPVLSSQPVRFVTDKSSGAPYNKIQWTNRKKRGLKVKDGEFVHKGDILVSQFGIVYYPGENVVMDEHNWTLRAAYDGIVVLTSEQLNPYPDSPLYQPVQDGLVLQKQFLCVIPTPLHGKFKLVSQT